MPASALIAGMPRWLRLRVYAPIASTKAVRAAFAFLSRPPIATAHFIATLVFRLLPAIQAKALADEALHDTMHFSMLLAGLFFWFCIFDPRSPPVGSRYASRIFALLATIVVSVPFGAYLSYKETLLYPMYHAAAVGLSPAVDERVGGMIQYVPGSMMLGVAVVIVLASWRRRELRLEAWGRNDIDTQHSARDVGTLKRRNLRTGLALAGICAFMLLAAIAAGVLYQVVP